MRPAFSRSRPTRTAARFERVELFVSDDHSGLKAARRAVYPFTLYSRFPGGFTPQFGGDLIDYSWVSGLRGFLSVGLIWDASGRLEKTTGGILPYRP